MALKTDRTTCQPGVSPVDVTLSDAPKPLVLLRDTERSLRQTVLTAIVPVLPVPLCQHLGELSLLADSTLSELADIDLEQITAAELRSARILIGLTFVGIGALAIALLLLYLSTVQSQLSPLDQLRQSWYGYIAGVGLGVSGLFMLGREAMRSPRSRHWE